MNKLNHIYEWHPGRTKAPTLLLLHGTGGTEHDLLELGAALLPGAHRLSPRGNVDENGMARFFRRLSEGVFDLDDLAFRTKQLETFVLDASKDYGFDPRRVVAVGFSNGANIAASLLLSGSPVLCGAVLFHAMVPFVPESPLNLTGTSVFLGAGERDPLVSVAQTRQLSDLLEKAGALVTLSWQPGGHQLTRPEVNAAADWLQQGEQLWNSKDSII